MGVCEAGRKGEDIRSDCWVRIELRDSGGITLDLQSKVESMYGQSIREQVSALLKALRIDHAAMELVDSGALPYTIAARLEAAVRRLGVDVGEGALPEFSPHCRYGTTRDRLRRSRLYLPGNEPKFMLNAGLHGPDAVILDLEDSVAPEVKDEARLLVRNALRTVDFRGAERMVRINPGQPGREDLEAVIPHNVHVVLVPKAESAEQVREVDAWVQAILNKHGVSREVYLMPIVESASGVLRAFEIASASRRVVALAIGLEDYTADLGVTRTNEGRESYWARSQIVNAARAAGVQPIDTVFSDVADMEGLLASVKEAKALGFDGKGCIHPRQIAVIHEGFAPTEEEMENARRIVAAFDEAQRRGLGVVALGGKMIDPPVVKRAQQIMNLAERTGHSVPSPPSSGERVG
jgi:citrate lyase subunit beta/citryl-CoA lyase